MMSKIVARLRKLAVSLGTVTFKVSMVILGAEVLTWLSRRTDRSSTSSRALASHNHPPRQASTLTPIRPQGRRAVSADAIPIIFIHKGDSEHLKYSLAQAKTSNPDSTVFLLGDESNGHYDGIEHQRFDRYFTGAVEFKELYRHYSTNSFDFELICFQRWFVLREFLKTREIPQCVYLDSDVLLYANITDDLRKFSRYDFTLCWNTIGCVFFLHRMEGLDQFCDFLKNIYSGKDRYHYDKMVSHFAARRAHRLPGGVCDMTALQLFNELNFGQVGEASQIIDGSVYDPNINMPHPGFEMEEGIKKVVWKDGQPYGRFVRTGEEIRFNSLHFNGRAKRLMSEYCTATLEARSPAAASGAVP